MAIRPCHLDSFTAAFSNIHSSQHTGYLQNHFLFPARRGRGILVVPGFCPASRFLVGAKTQKTTGQIFFEILP